MKNLNIKTVCIVLIIAIALSITGCVSVEPNVTGLTGSTAATNPGGDTGGVNPGATDPADPGSDGPSKPVDPSTPSVPAPSEPVDPSTPSEPVIPSDPVVTEPGHEHEYVAVVTKATCIEVGYTTYTCDCGDTYVGDRIEAPGHQWSDWVVTKEPTVDETGEAVSVCAVCENTQSKTIGKITPNHTHSYTEKVTKAATCTAEGVMTLTCDCGDQYAKAIAKIAHSYTKSVTAPTCTNKGYTTYKCSCGDSYKDDYVSAKGHTFGSYKPNGDATCTKDGTKTATCSVCGSKETKTDAGSAKGHSYSFTETAEPTMWSEGYSTYTCSHCGSIEERDRVDKVPKEEFERMVAEAVVKYINQFRKEQGDTETISLPGLTLVAEYRAVQLQEKFEHSTADLREAYAYYEYGEWHDNTAYGGTQYWSANAKEAITKGAGLHGTADEIGYDLARSFLDSPGHWSYVGSSDFPYIGVGVTYDSSNWYSFKCCVLQTSKNYG